MSKHRINVALSWTEYPDGVELEQTVRGTTEINGWQLGELLLKEVARRYEETAGPDEHWAGWIGDEPDLFDWWVDDEGRSWVSTKEGDLPLSEDPKVAALVQAASVLMHDDLLPPGQRGDGG